jgi:hypothetical protein
MVIAHVSVRYATCCRMSLRETLRCKLRYSMYLTQVGGPKRKPGGGRRIQAAVLPEILTDLTSHMEIKVARTSVKPSAPQKRLLSIKKEIYIPRT